MSRKPKDKKVSKWNSVAVWDWSQWYNPRRFDQGIEACPSCYTTVCSVLPPFIDGEIDLRPEECQDRLTTDTGKLFYSSVLVSLLVVSAFYAPAIRRMVERACSVSPVHASISVCIRDGISNLCLSFSGVISLLLRFSGVSNLLSFSGRSIRSVSFGHISNYLTLKVQGPVVQN